MDIEIMGVQEVAQRLGVTRQRVYQLVATHPDFPKPMVELHCGRIWKAAEIDRWAKVWATREPRRKPKPAHPTHCDHPNGYDQREPMTGIRHCGVCQTDEPLRARFDEEPFELDDES